MDSRSLTYIMILAFAAIILLFVNNAIDAIGVPRLDKYISPYEVRGMSLLHKGTPYTLNFHQQNVCVDSLNRGIAVGAQRQGHTDAPFEKLVIYRFQQPDIELPVVSLSDGSLVFHAPEWSKAGYLAEVSGGDMWHALSTAYGP